MILFIYKYLWLITLIILYTMGWIYAIRQIRDELAGKEIYHPIFNPSPFFVIWFYIHCAIILVAIAILIVSSFDYWLTGELPFK